MSNNCDSTLTASQRLLSLSLFCCSLWCVLVDQSGQNYMLICGPVAAAAAAHLTTFRKFSISDSKTVSIWAESVCVHANSDGKNEYTQMRTVRNLYIRLICCNLDLLSRMTAWKPNDLGSIPTPYHFFFATPSNRSNFACTDYSLTQTNPPLSITTPTTTISRMV